MIVVNLRGRRNVQGFLPLQGKKRGSGGFSPPFPKKEGGFWGFQTNADEHNRVHQIESYIIYFRIDLFESSPPNVFFMIWLLCANRQVDFGVKTMVPALLTLMCIGVVVVRRV
jgi:hypothetical protein